MSIRRRVRCWIEVVSDARLLGGEAGGGGGRGGGGGSERKRDGEVFMK